jgi:hypothetical protein
MSTKLFVPFDRISESSQYRLQAEIKVRLTPPKGGTPELSAAGAFAETHFRTTLVHAKSQRQF